MEGTTSDAALTRRLRAVRDVAALVRRSRTRKIDAVAAVATTARACRARQLPLLREQARSLRLGPTIEPIDPTDFVTTALHVLDYHEGEIRWTRWLRGIVAGNGGQASREILVRALSDVVAAANPELAGDAAIGGELIAEVRAEVRASDGSQLDLVIWTARSLIVVENKLFADWHDGEGDGTGQAKSYQLAAESMTTGDDPRRCVLIVLTAGTKIEVPPPWTKILYRDLARTLRQSLAERLGPASSLHDVLALAPILELVKETERLLFGHARASAHASAWDEYHELRALLRGPGVTHEH